MIKGSILKRRLFSTTTYLPTNLPHTAQQWFFSPTKRRIRGNLLAYCCNIAHGRSPRMQWRYVACSREPSDIPSTCRDRVMKLCTGNSCFIIAEYKVYLRIVTPFQTAKLFVFLFTQHICRVRDLFLQLLFCKKIKWMDYNVMSWCIFRLNYFI